MAFLLLSKSVLLLLFHHLEVRAYILMLAMCRTKWPATYTRYFAVWMQLLPEPQSSFSFHLGEVTLITNSKKKNTAIYQLHLTLPQPNALRTPITGYAHQLNQ